MDPDNFSSIKLAKDPQIESLIEVFQSCLNKTDNSFEDFTKNLSKSLLPLSDSRKAWVSKLMQLWNSRKIPELTAVDVTENCMQFLSEQRTREA